MFVLDKIDIYFIQLTVYRYIRSTSAGKDSVDNVKQI